VFVNLQPEQRRQLHRGLRRRHWSCDRLALPHRATEYHQFAPPTNTAQAGLDNWGVAYAEVQAPMGTVHVFCGSQANVETGMNAAAAQTLNAAQNQDLLNYIQSKAQGGIAVYMADTGSGPAVITSPTGPANAQWPTNFATLQSGLSDALLANLTSSSLPLSAAACTYGCGNAAEESYVDHIMTAGKGTTTQRAGSQFVRQRGTRVGHHLPTLLQ
jgi:hypothetical protein